MPISRILHFASRNRSRDALNLLQRCGPLKRFQCRGYSKSTKDSNGRRSSSPVVTVKQQKFHSSSTSSHSWSNFVAPAAGILGFVGVALLFYKNDQRRVVLKGKGNCDGRQNCSGPVIGGPFSLIDTDQRPVTEKSLRGNWVLLYFGYTSSPDVGPEQVQMMAKATDILESKQNFKLMPVFITIDPERDSPLHLRSYLKEMDSRILGVTGPVTAIRQMAQQYRVHFRKVEEDGDDYLVESSHNMYLLNPDMEVVRCFGTEYNAEELAQALLKEIKGNSG